MSDKNGSEDPGGYAASIFLPQVFRNMRNAKLFAVDIGELKFQGPATITKQPNDFLPSNYK